MGTRHLYWILTGPSFAVHMLGPLDQADLAVGREASHPIKASRKARISDKTNRKRRQ
jgi:hypothetical protein